MIKLHQYPSAFDLPSLSPFCIKVEFFLKMANIPYEVVVEHNPAKGPKGKMPFIEHGTKIISDSSFIIDYLLNEFRISDLDIHNPEVRAQAHAVKIMIEEGLYFILLYSRWVDPDGYRIIIRDFSKLFPPLIGNPFLSFIRRNLIKQARAQGIGRHTPEEVYSIGKTQIDTLSELLGKKTYFFENRVTYIDATIYAFLVTIFKQPIESPLKKHLSTKINLINYIERLD